MTPSSKYNAVTAERPAEPSGFGRSWIRPSLLMPKVKTSGWGSSPEYKPFITIDDLVEKAQELSTGLKKLSEYKHPLDIRRGMRRKGVKKRMNESSQSKQLKARGRTYFLDIQETKEGKPYLRITESRKGEGDKFERNSVNVFPEDAGEFAQAVSEMASKLGQEKSA